MASGPLAHHFFTMACNNAWANLRLLSAISKLPAEEIGASRPSFFGSLLATANHQVTVDWFYVDALERAFASREPHESPATFFDPEIPFDDFSLLLQAQRDVDARLIAVCRERSDDELNTEVRIRRRSGMARDPAVRILAHLFQHQIHHRGQMHGLLSSTDQPPPQLDEFFCTGDAEHRAPELLELGLAEGALWDV